MPNNTVAADNLFQTNVLLWALLPQPKGSRIVPVLRETGHELVRIECPLRAGLVERAELAKLTVQISQNPAVDLLLVQRNKRYVLVECKSGSFGIATDQAEQARGMLVAALRLSSRISLPADTVAELCYVVPMEETSALDVTLVNLAQTIASLGFGTCPTGALGISIKEDGVYLGLSAPLSGTGECQARLTPEQKVISLSPGEDPRPLYILPWMPKANNALDLQAFREQLRQQLLVWVGRVRVNTTTVLDYEDLLNRMTRNVFKDWGDRSSLNGEVYPVIEKWIAVLVGGDSRIIIRRSSMEVAIRSQEDREQLQEGIRSASLPAPAPEGEQLPLQMHNESSNT